MRRLALVAFLLVACGSAGIVPHTVALGYKAGDTYKYTLAASLKYTVGLSGMSIPLDLDLSAKETVTVKSVDSGGTADLSIALSDMTLKTTANGTTNTTTTTTSPPIDMKVASDGRIVSINGDALGGSAMPGMSQMGGLVTAILPDGSVKPGDSWTKDYDQANPKGGGTIHVTSKNKYLRDEKVKGVQSAVIESNIGSNIDLSIDMSALGSAGVPLFPSGGTGGGAAVQSLTVKGTTTSVVTSWIDAGAKRLAQTHSTGTLDATMTINMAAGATNPFLTGPLTFKGTQTMDMNPA
jgi:hypothetical protein